MNTQQDLQTTIDAFTAEKQDLSTRLTALAESIARMDEHAAQLLEKQTNPRWSLDKNKHELVYDDKTFVTTTACVLTITSPLSTPRTVLRLSTSVLTTKTFSNAWSLLLLNMKLGRSKT